MSELSIGINVHCDASTTAEGYMQLATIGAPAARYITIKNQGGYYSNAVIFLTAKVAAAIHRELERLYPELVAAAADVEPPGDVVVHYAEEHTGEIDADAAIDPALAELRASPNARKFGAPQASND